MLVCLLLYCLRGPELIINPRFWAEDGAIFFAQDFQFGFEAIFLRYNGYLHLWPRLIACCGGFIPLENIPAFYVTSSILTYLILLLSITSSRFPATLGQKALLMLATILVPHGGEIFFNLANLISVCALIFIAIAIAQPATSITVRLIEGVGILLAGLSGPFTILMMFPLLIFFLQQKWAYSKKVERIVPLLLSCLLQILCLVENPRKPSAPDQYLGHWLDFTTKTIKSVFFADIRMSRYLALVLAVLITALLFSLFFKNLRGLVVEIKRMSASTVLLISGITILSAGVFMHQAEIMKLGPFENGQRYFYPPFVLFLFAIILKNGEYTLSLIQQGLIALAFLTSACFYPSDRTQPGKYSGIPAWNDQVAAFRRGEVSEFIIEPNWVFRVVSL